MLDPSANIEVQHHSDHERYEQFCALASSGALTDSEWSQLAEHLRACTSCRKQLSQYREVSTYGMALVAPTDASLEAEQEWSPETAVARLMNTLQEQGCEVGVHAAGSVFAPAPTRGHWFQWLSFPLVNAALPYAAAAALFVVVSGSLFITGVRIGRQRVNAYPQAGVQLGSTLDSLLRERDDLNRQVQSLADAMAARSRDLEATRVLAEQLRVQKQASDSAVSRMEAKARAVVAEAAQFRLQQEALDQERTAISEKFRQSEANLVVAQRNFESLRDQHTTDLIEISRLEGAIAEASHQPHPAQYVAAREVTSPEPELSELMGARDLFIADVYDIDKDGLPRKPFGRVFYTRGRSLLFYAFDLIRQPGVKDGCTFQVWGRRGYGDAHPINMGMMYLDSTISNRWALKFTDAKALAQVDAVFVTIEPRGGSDAPKGRQLLYASLRTPPNHP